MAEESRHGQEQQPPPPPPTQTETFPGLFPGLHGAEHRIKSSICKSVQSKVESILQDVEKFSDIEKLYLYLKLPSYSSSTADKSDQSGQSSSRVQQVHAFNWIHNHLEEHMETSLPKQEVYDEYKSFCDNLNYHPLSAADFGKMMKNMFPNMKARRLGIRGKSKYCYSGLRKRPFIHMPSLPTLDLLKTVDASQCDAMESSGHLGSIKEDVQFAACNLVCEWAQKVLKRQFDAIEDLARFLIDSHYISNKSLAALTIMTSTSTEAKTPQNISAFVPAAESQPHSTTLSSLSVDAKQQLQRKIQRKQQEQKLHSFSPVEGQTKRPCETPTPPPTIGIMITAIPSPITVQRNVELSPVGMLENKVVPISLQMVTHEAKSLKQSQKPAKNKRHSSVEQRKARQRYAQILPKPPATGTIALHSPSAMIIANNPVQTVMTTCHVNPVNLVKISLAPNSSATTTTLTNMALRPTSAGIPSEVAEDDDSVRYMTGGAAGPLRKGQNMNTANTDVGMEVTQTPSIQSLSQQGYPCRGAGAVQRAASVPIPQTKGLLCLEEASNTTCNEKGSFSFVASGGSSNTNACHISTSSSQNTSTLSSLLGISGTLSSGKNSQAMEGNMSRKRSGLSPNSAPIKRLFIPQQPLEGAASLGCNFRPSAPVRPESAPVTTEVEMKINSALSAPVNMLGTSSFRPCGFYSVAKTQSSMQRNNTLAVLETGTTVSHPLIQQQQGHTVVNAQAMPNNPGFQKYLAIGSHSSMGSLQGTQEQTYSESNPAPESTEFLNQASTVSQLSLQADMDYFTFDDDVTQDSIMEELVQMEEQIKLNNQQGFRSCVTMQEQQAATADNMTPTNQTMTDFYHAANNSRNPVPTPTPTPTPTPEMIGGAHSLTGESPCSYLASTTPVDSSLGSSRHTPAGTPHSNCSSTVPPSPVECRNPFAFTPINSSTTSFNDGSIVKPMQRPMATHPDKTRLEWMNNSYDNSSGSTNKASSSMGILPSYQGYHFHKPHAFAIPHARHHDGHSARLTPISPIQQQVASMANMTRQEGFAVPAPLDSKTSNTSSTAMFRCRSVSPAVHQKNLGGNAVNSSFPNVCRSLVSPFSSLAAPEEWNMFANMQTDFGVSSMAQRSHSVPLSIMMQTEVLPMRGQQCSSSKNISSVPLSKLDRDHEDSVQSVGINISPSTYTARMNLTQIPESSPDPSCSDLNQLSNETTSTCKLQRPNYLIDHACNNPMSLSAGGSQIQSTSRGQSAMLGLNSQQQQEELKQHQQQFVFSSSQELLTGGGGGLVVGAQLMEQVSELASGGADFPCEIRMTSELSNAINDLNTMDTNLLFDPSLQQSSYPNTVPEELVTNSLFQQIASDAAHASDLDWLENKEHPAVGLMG